MLIFLEKTDTETGMLNLGRKKNPKKSRKYALRIKSYQQ